jgi:hypothetical protein
LKEEKRLAAERRGDMDLRFAKWTVSFFELYGSVEGRGNGKARENPMANSRMGEQNGKQGDMHSVADANAAAYVETANAPSS